ncbi:hypothetical protein [Noviherbaspirillum pedocola]|uniref:DUF2783 domain-containing protein n=1 Tax=Noviherbaspirillum pedocola TaxID=2801341 RepID=A0A934SXY1_9BURK|nr:hypothetical protein [Noviherbaspirillum pedocola]MBK4737782.1 hypothetical protein [Noviherbaspirillum pedocola]
MTEEQLDAAYTDFCRELDRVGERGAMAALSRFALLAMLEIDDPERIGVLMRKAVEAARDEQETLTGTGDA